MGGPVIGRIERLEQSRKRSEDIGMRLALGQGRGDQRRRRGEPGQPTGIVDKACGMGADQLAADHAQMFRETPAPHRGDLVARLQHRALPRRLPAPRQAQMPPVLARQQLDDQRALAVPAQRYDKPRVSPLHQRRTNVSNGSAGLISSFPRKQESRAGRLLPWTPPVQARACPWPEQGGRLSAIAFAGVTNFDWRAAIKSAITRRSRGRLRRSVRGPRPSSRGL